MFQVNLAQRLLSPAREPAIELYRRLRSCNPATFAGLLHNDTASIAELRDRGGGIALTGWNLRPHGAAVRSQ